MALATLSIDIVAKLADLQAGMDKAGRIVQQQVAGIQQGFARVQGVAASLGAGIIAGLAGAQVLASFRATVDGLDALNDAADATGSSIEQLSGLEDIALRTGANLDVVTSAVVKLNQVLNSATPDSTQAAALKAIGLSAEELRRLDPADALLKVAQALAGYADDGNKARLVQELLGKSARELAPFLKDLAERGQIVATVTTEQAAAAERLNKQIASWDANVGALARTLASTVLPELNKMLMLVTELSRGPGIGASLLEVLKGNVVSSPQSGLDLYRGKIADIDERLRVLRSDKRPLIAANAQAEIANLEAQRAKLASFADVYRNVLNAGGAGAGRGSVTGLPGPQSVGTIPDKPKTAPKAKDFEPVEVGDLDKYLQRLYAARDATEDLTEVQKAERAIASANAQGFSEATRREILAIAETMDQRRESLALRKLERDANEEIVRQEEARAARLAGLLADTGVGRQKQELDSLLFLYKEYTEGRIASELEYQQAVDAVLNRNKAQVKELDDFTKSLGLTFSSAFEDAIVGGGKLSDVLKSLEADIVRIITRKYVTEPLTGAIGKMFDSSGGAEGGIGNLIGTVGKSLGGFLGGLFGSFDGGGDTGSGPRMGGLDGKGGFLAMIHPQETIVDRTRGQRAGAGAMRHLSITINPPAGMSRQSGQQFAAQVAREISLADARNN